MWGSGSCPGARLSKCGAVSRSFQTDRELLGMPYHADASRRHRRHWRVHPRLRWGLLLVALAVYAGGTGGHAAGWTAAGAIGAVVGLYAVLWPVAPRARGPQAVRPPSDSATMGTTRSTERTSGP